MSNLRKQRFGWYVYDWANSAFSTSVITVFLGPYLTSVAKTAADASGMIHPFGLTIHPGSWFSFVVSASVIMQVFILPMIGAITDSWSNKKALISATAFTGAIATTFMYMISVSAGNYMLGGLLFVIANLAFGASIVVFNSFLPMLANAADRDKVSSRGWALGYLGGGLLLAVHLMYFSSVESEGGSVELAIRTILASVGIWWGLFTLVPLLLMKFPRAKNSEPPALKQSFGQLYHTFKTLRYYPQTLLFFVAYLMYNETVQTVITMSAQFGQEEIGLGMDVLMQAILIVQFVGIIGSLMFERIASLVGTKQAIIIALFGWVGVLVAGYALVTTATHFYILASVIAIVLGGTQALSRSLFSTMIPVGKEAEYFSLYEISDKGTSWLGPLFFGLALTLTGSYRIAVFSLIIFLLVGMVLLMRVNVKKAVMEAENAVH
ncbi:MAG: MFS transporter [Ignavibacteria bacterium]|nr:MFS transporter [Ignavibacteria bacterium]